MPLFGLPMPPEEVDESTAKLLWQWFHVNETDIVRLMNGSKKESKSVLRQVDVWLCPVFPYVKSNRIDFDLCCKEGALSFTFRHGGNEKLAADAEIFGNMMPEGLTKTWTFCVEE